MPASSSSQTSPGNTTYKAVQRSAQVVSIGPMLQGLTKPVNDLSRGAFVDDIVYTLASPQSNRAPDSHSASGRCVPGRHGPHDYGEGCDPLCISCFHSSPSK